MDIVKTTDFKSKSELEKLNFTPDNEGISNFTPFLPTHIKNKNAHNESLCIRFLRRKYSCFIIYCLLVIVFLQTIVNIMSKIDDPTFNNLITHVSNSILKLKNSTDFCNCTQNTINE